ncbi:hypothetical protein [Actinomyces wuliandei]|uniref:hypothetical protein n=1 Tax=Actinomyces wuliandei TaxID=2057743 RepID=UPI000FDAF25D|nr:hypothetical protein [Actinomyces wuliandei]
MRDVRTEARKHLGFFSVCAVVLATTLLLRELLDSYRSVTEVVWVFAVILVSAATTFYVGAHVFVFLVLKGDVLLQLSTRSPLRKLLVKTLPLAAGFCATGLITLLTYATTWPEQGRAGAVAYAVCAKLVSCAALVSLAWLLGLAAAGRRGFYLRLLVYAGGLVVLVGLQAAAVWSTAGLEGTGWTVGASTSYTGYPVYYGPLGVCLGTPFTTDSTGPYVLSLVLNTLWVGVCLLAVGLTSRLRHRGAVRLHAS